MLRNRLLVMRLISECDVAGDPFGLDHAEEGIQQVDAGGAADEDEGAHGDGDDDGAGEAQGLAAAHPDVARCARRWSP